MGKTMQDWEKEMESKTTAELMNIVSSCKALKGVECLNKEFQWTGIFLVGAIAENVMKRRAEEVQ